MFQKLLKLLGHIKRLISKSGRFYTVSEKRLANLHFFSGKGPNIACIIHKLLSKFTILIKKLLNCPFKWSISD